MKKYLSIFVVALMATFSVGSFLSCGSDDDDDPTTKQDDNARDKAAMVFKFYVTQDMLKYFDVSVKAINGDKVIADTKLTADNVTKYQNILLNIEDLYEHTITLAADALPATFTFSRVVKMKENVDLTDVESIRFSTSHSYVFYYYNAAGQQINDPDAASTTTAVSAMAGKTEAVVKKITEGGFDKTFKYTFDKTQPMKTE